MRHVAHMNFDEIPLRMAKLGVDRIWLMKECRYSKSTLANILAPKGSNKNERALETIWNALDREEERQEKPVLPAPLGHRVFIEPTGQQFDRWMQAAYSRPGRNFDQWVKTGLDSLAAEELANLSSAPSPKAEIKAMEDPPRKQSKRKLR